MHLVGMAVGIENGTAAPEVAERLFELVELPTPSRDAAPIPVAPETRRALDELAREQRRQAIAALQESNAALVDQRIASLDLYYRGLLSQLDGVLSANTDARILRMKASERERRTAEHARGRAEIERRRDADIIGERIAVGVLEVLHGD